MLGDRFAHRAALLRVRERGVEGGPGHPHRARGDVDTTDLERAEDVTEPAARVAEERVGRHLVAVVHHLDGLDALVAELADVLADGDALELRSRILLDDEARDAFVGAGREGDDARALAVRHPHLRAGDHVLVAVAHRATRQVARVAPRVRFRERQTPAHLAARHARQPAGLLLLGAVMHDEVRGDRVRVDDSRERHPAVGKLFDHADVREQIEPEPAVSLGDRDPEEPERLHVLDDGLRILVGVLHLRSRRESLRGR